MTNKRRVVVTGVGAITPIGNDCKTFWQSLIIGKNGVGRVTQFDTTGFTCHIDAEVKGYDPSKYFNSKEVKRLDRFAQFAVVTSREAVTDSGLDIEKEDKQRIGVIVGSGIGGLWTIENEYKVMLKGGPSRISPFFIPMLITNIAAGMVAIEFGVKGPNFCTTTACASSNHALGEGLKTIQDGRADIMLAGGSEACITPMGFGGFCAIKALSLRNDDPEHASRPFDKQRDGFIMGEGSGMLVLEELNHALKRNAKIYAELIGYGASNDAYHMTAPDPEGAGAALCMKNALDDAGIKPEEVSYINAHGTSTVLNDKIETLAIKKIFGQHAYKVPVSSTKSMTGHLLGATAAVEAIACVMSIQYGIIPPTINYEFKDPECDLDYVPNKARKQDVNIAISNSLGFGGHNATIVLKKYTA